MINQSFTSFMDKYTDNVGKDGGDTFDTDTVNGILDSTFSTECNFNYLGSLDPKNMSNEVYFGKDNSFRTEVVTIIGKLREEIRIAVGAEWSNRDKVSAILRHGFDSNDTKLKPVMAMTGILEGIIKKYTNIEKCSIAYVQEFNASTYPAIYDPALLYKDYDKNPKLKDIDSKIFRENIKSAKELSDALDKEYNSVEIGPDGYRFKESNNKVIILFLGLNMLLPNIEAGEPSMSDEDVAYILFHELGHNFHHCIVGAKETIINTHYMNRVKTFYKLLDGWSNSGWVILGSLLSAATIGVLLTGTAMTLILTVILLVAAISNMYGKDTDIVKLISGMVVEVDDKPIDRTGFSNIVKEYYNDKSFRNKKPNFLMSGVVYLCRIIVQLCRVFKPIDNVINNFITTIGIRAIWGNDIDRNKMYEQFADTFAISYGFGANHAKVHAGFIRIFSNKVNDCLVINNIPFLGTILAITDITRNNTLMEVTGYSPSYVRIAEGLTVLEYELSNNKDLTKEQMEEIREHIDCIKQEYKNGHSDMKNGKSILTKLWLDITRKNIGNSQNDSDIIHNVCSSLVHIAKSNSSLVKDVNKTANTLLEEDLTDTQVKDIDKKIAKTLDNTTDTDSPISKFLKRLFSN